MPNEIKSISNPRLKLEILSPEEIDPSQNALEIWESNGAQVDWSSSVVKIPSNLLEEAIRLAPPVYTLSARQIEQDLPLDGNHV
jgi:trimethylamine:corrinoid methyltransferase-like protein